MRSRLAAYSIPQRRGNAQWHSQVRDVPTWINSGDDVCILPCTVNAWSELGAMSPDDCFCKNGTYKVEKTQTCDSCSGDAGIHCAGGFAYNSSGNREHRMPKSKAGYYLVGLAWSERCTINVESTSTCLGGAPFANQSLACAEGHTGPLCAACRFGWTRDTSEQACVPCSPASSVALVAAMNFDAFCKKNGLEDGHKLAILISCCSDDDD